MHISFHPEAEGRKSHARADCRLDMMALLLEHHLLLGLGYSAQDAKLASHNDESLTGAGWEGKDDEVFRLFAGRNPVCRSSPNLIG